MAALLAKNFQDLIVFLEELLRKSNLAITQPTKKYLRKNLEELLKYNLKLICIDGSLLIYSHTSTVEKTLKDLLKKIKASVIAEVATIIFFLSGFSFTTTHESQDFRARGRSFF